MTGRQLNDSFMECAAGRIVPVDEPCPYCGATKDGYCGEEFGDLKPIMDSTIIKLSDGKSEKEHNL